MPELPEVETLRRDLERYLVGQSIAGVEVRLAKMIRPPGSLPPEAVLGHQIVALRRRAKHLIWDLSDDLAVLFHLKLTGQMILEDPTGRRVVWGGHPIPRYDAPLPHRATHVIFDFQDSSRLYFTDIRQFGYLRFLTRAEVAEHLAQQQLGPEPLDAAFTGAVFESRIAQRPRAILKALLLDQSFVSGLGNIYADEALHEARLHPLRRAGDLSRAARQRLHRAIRSVLQRAVSEGVAEIVNNRALETREFPRVHGREGRPCYGCGRSILRVRVGTRSTYFCPGCQRAPKDS